MEGNSAPFSLSIVIVTCMNEFFRFLRMTDRLACKYRVLIDPIPRQNYEPIVQCNGAAGGIRTTNQRNNVMMQDYLFRNIKQPLIHQENDPSL